jgi:hypothetical protein
LYILYLYTCFLRAPVGGGSADPRALGAELVEGAPSHGASMGVKPSATLGARRSRQASSRRRRRAARRALRWRLSSLADYSVKKSSSAAPSRRTFDAARPLRGGQRPRPLRRGNFVATRRQNDASTRVVATAR